MVTALDCHGTSMKRVVGYRDDIKGSRAGPYRRGIRTVYERFLDLPERGSRLCGYDPCSL